MTNVDDLTFAESLWTPIRRSMLLRVLGLAGLILLLGIPIGMIDSTIAERSMRRDEAIAEVTRTWGARQVVRGPFLTVPYVWHELEDVIRDGKQTTLVQKHYGSFHMMPEQLTVEGEIRTETRRRGIFDVPVYVADLEVRGTFRVPDVSEFPALTSAVQWDKASLTVGVDDPQAIRENVVLSWGYDALPMRPGPGELPKLERGLHTAVTVTGPAGTTVPFALRLTVAGSGGFSVVPAGTDTTVVLRSPWPDPSFDGAFLPVARYVRKDGFEATWRVLELARGIPGSWVGDAIGTAELDPTALGVTLLTPVDAYRTTERAVKYQLLFVGLTFTALFLFELLAGVRIHPIQYLLVGLALCLFYLLLLSLAEHIGFVVAYALASAAIVVLVGSYSRAVLGSRRRTAAVAALVTALYLYLFVLLHIQDFALLVGSLGLFAILAIVMYLTRRVDWYAIHVGGGQGLQEAAG